MAWKVGDCWPNADAVGRRRQRLASSGPSSSFHIVFHKKQPLFLSFTILSNVNQFT